MPAIRKNDRNGPGMVTLFCNSVEFVLCDEGLWAAAAATRIAKIKKAMKSKKERRHLITHLYPLRSQEGHATESQIRDNSLRLRFDIANGIFVNSSFSNLTVKNARRPG